MMQLRLTIPSPLTARVVAVLADDPAVSSVSVLPGASVKPAGDVVEAHVAREATNDVVDRLLALGVHDSGTLQLEPVHTWISRAGLEAERLAPGSSADSVVWPEVTKRAYGDAELNWTFVSFMTMATLLAAIAIVLDSSILTVGAMVLGPEFGAIAALGVAVVRRRPGLLRQALVTLVTGFVVAIAVTLLASLVFGAIGWVSAENVTRTREATDFIYHPNRWSVVVAVIAAAAGVLSLTSAKIGGLSGVFISVTTIPAAGNIGLAAAFGIWTEVRGSALQLVINVSAMALAGAVTLGIQQLVWSRVSAYRARLVARVRPRSAGSSSRSPGSSRPGRRSPG